MKIVPSEKTDSLLHFVVIVSLLLHSVTSSSSSSSSSSKKHGGGRGRGGGEGGGGHDGNTHPVLQSGDFASIGPPDSRGPFGGGGPSTDRPAAPAEGAPSGALEEVPDEEEEDGKQTKGAPPPRMKESNGNEFFRPKRTSASSSSSSSSASASSSSSSSSGKTHLHHHQAMGQQPAIENLVSNLKNQLRESQAAQVHTRSIINVLQEKVDAQETDLSIMKNEISLLRREQTAQRDLIATLTSSASDASWAIANVKRSHDQMTGDVRTLKRVQESHNDTLRVMRAEIANNSVELLSRARESSSVERSVFRLRAEATEDRERLDGLQRDVAQLRRTSAGSDDGGGGRVPVDESDTTITNHLPGHVPPDGPAARSASSSSVHGRGSEAVEGGGGGGGTVVSVVLPSSVATKLSEHDEALELANGLLGNISDHVTAVEAQLSVMSQRQLMDTQLLHFQQSFINFTSQIYQLQQWRKTQTEQGRNTEEFLSQHENDMASVIFHLESQTERLLHLEELVTEYRTKDRPVVLRLDQTVSELNQSVTELLEAEKNRTQSTEREEETEDRLRTVEEGFLRIDSRTKELEIAVLNVSLSQCRAVNEVLMDDVRSGNYVRQMADVQMKISEQTTALARLDRGLIGIFQELDKNSGASSAFAEQLDELRKLAPDVTTLQREMLNFVLQLPTDCHDVPDSTGNDLHDGVYLIRPQTSRQSARTFCQVDPDDPDRTPDRPPPAVWTVIQRRLDGRESFARTWDDYRSGFGDPGGEFWLGNENIHRLTSSSSSDHRYRLRVDLWDVLGRYWTADYASFRVHSEDALYRLELGEFSGGNATDALRYSNLMPFSAVDRDNDVSTTHCAQFYQSGWWYKHCHYSNLNGRYTSGVVWFHQGVNEWIQLRQTTMRISVVAVTTAAVAPGDGGGGGGGATTNRPASSPDDE